MKFHFLKKSLRPLLASLIISSTISANVFAAPSQNDSFEGWLEKYGAWDILDSNYSTTEDSPDLILKRAHTAYKLGRYSSCLNILQGTPAFEDKTKEIDRLWLGGQTQRSLGDPVKAVIWFSQAARLMNQDDLASKFNSEPNLKNIWFDVWRSLYWGYFVTPSSSKEARRMLLEQSFSQAEQVWPRTYFVIHSKPEVGSLGENSALLPSLSNSTMITDDDRIAIARSLASASLGEWAESRKTLDGISNATVHSFWDSVTNYLENGERPESLEIFTNKGLVHPHAFFEAEVLEPIMASPALWQLAVPSSPAWGAFRKKLLEMNPQEALETIDRETGSMLLSNDLVNALQNYRLAFAFLGGDMDLAKRVWKKLDHDTLPLSLRIASAIVFKPNFSKIINSHDNGRPAHFYIISNLCEAAGVNYFTSMKQPFWNSIPDSELNNLINGNPLDRLLLFHDLTSSFSNKKDLNTARRIAFLFQESELGAHSFIFLAQNAAQNRDFKLSAFYLKRVNQDKFGNEIRLKWLNAAVAYNLAVGEDAKALKGYNEIIESGGSLAPDKELKLALMIQQKGELQKAQAILERIWESRSDLNDELKAEILFWIAEGEHAMGDKDAALRNYLKLAWKFPEQNIWAVTAMYRASMIYEHKGQFETAKRFLNTVIKRADRKSQKEAAQARLNAIDGKLAKIGADGESSFPF